MAVPVNVDTVDRIAAVVADIYREGETALLRVVRDRLAAGHDGPTDWQTSRLAQLGALRRAAHHIVATMAATGSRETRAAVAAGYRSGSADAVPDLAEHLGHTATVARPAGAAARRGALAVQALADAAVDELRPVHSAVLPVVESRYRQAVAGAAARRLTGATSTREAAQAAWATLTRDGITGFTDSAGRNWRLHTYAEVAVRTAVMRAALHGQVDEYTAAGVRLVSVSDQPRECARCRRWERAVLALWGLSGPQIAPNPRTGEPVHVDVAGTLDEAMAAGLFHPHCGHQIAPYYPGVSILLRQGRTADPVGEAARDRQRAIERALRYWREQEAAAITPEVRRRAAAKVGAWDTAMAEHLAAHKTLTRKHHREFIGAGHIPPPGRVDDLAARLGVPGR